MMVSDLLPLKLLLLLFPFQGLPEIRSWPVGGGGQDLLYTVSGPPGSQLTQLTLTILFSEQVLFLLSHDPRAGKHCVLTVPHPFVAHPSSTEVCRRLMWRAKVVRSLYKACPPASYWLQVTLRELFAATSEGSDRAGSLGCFLIWLAS